VQVRGEDAVANGALGLIVSVVPGARDYSAERSGSRAQFGDARVIFEADYGLRVLAERDIARSMLHESLRAASRFQVKDGGAVQSGSGGGNVPVA
jgi:hypothetical protein